MITLRLWVRYEKKMEKKTSYVNENDKALNKLIFKDSLKEL